MKKIFLISLATTVIYAFTLLSMDNHQSIIPKVPEELYIHILKHAVKNNSDFKIIVRVSKKRQDLLLSEDFNSVPIFYQASTSLTYSSDDLKYLETILNNDFLVEYGAAYTLGNYYVPPELRDTIQFTYTEISDIEMDANNKKIFWYNQKQHIAVSVNPYTTYVYNEFLLPTSVKKITLAEHIEQYNKKKEIEKTITPGIGVTFNEDGTLITYNLYNIPTTRGIRITDKYRAGVRLKLPIAKNNFLDGSSLNLSEYTPSKITLSTDIY